MPPQDPPAHHDPSGDSPLQALRWHPQQPCGHVDLGPAGHGSHLLGLPLDRGGRGQGERCLWNGHSAQGRGEASLCPTSCSDTKAHRSGQVGAGSEPKGPEWVLIYFFMSWPALTSAFLL